MQMFKTVTQTQTTNVDSVHYTEAHKVLENAQKAVADLCLDYDCTGARQYCMYANVFAALTNCYYSADNSEYISVAEIMHCFSSLTYYDDSYIYDECVANTALAKVNLLDYVCLSN